MKALKATVLEHVGAQLKTGRLELRAYQVNGGEVTIRFAPPRRRLVRRSGKVK